MKNVGLTAAILCGICSSAWGGSGYVAAVGSDATNCYLKIARLDDLGGTPSAVQTQIDISADFYRVDDVAWLPGLSGQPKRLAVLGNANDYVATDRYVWPQYNPPAGPVGTTHRLTGDIKIYDVSPTLAVSKLGSADLDYTFQPFGEYETDASVELPRQANLRFHIAALGSGGFVVQGMASRTWLGFLQDGTYNLLVGFDNTWNQRVASSVRTSYLGGDNNYDIAGIAVADDDLYGSVHVRAVTGGSQAGIVSRYHLDWETGFNLEAELFGDSAGCYYMSAVSPLADVDGHAMQNGVLISNNGQGSYNAPVDFSDGDQLTYSQNWGYLSTSINETMGIDSESGGMYAVLRRNDTDYDLFSIDPVTGAYTDESFAFTWDGTPWTIQSSDGNAMSSTPPWPGDTNRDGKVNVTDLGTLATHYGTESGAEWGHGDFTGEGSVDVNDLGVLATHYGFGTSALANAVPEPGTMLLLGIGAVVLNVCGLRRR